MMKRLTYKACVTVTIVGFAGLAIAQVVKNTSDDSSGTRGGRSGSFKTIIAVDVTGGGVEADDELSLDDASDVDSASAAATTALPTTLEPMDVAARAEARVDRMKPVRVRQTVTQAVAKLKSIRACEVHPAAGCPVNHPMAKASPEGYNDVLVEQTVAELAFLKALAQRELTQGRTPSFSVSEVAGAYIKHRDDHVREQALDLAGLLVSSDPKKALQVAVRAIISTVSGPLAAQAMAVMVDVYRLSGSRMPSGGSRAVDQVLTQALTTGGWDVRDAVAENILPFLNRENRAAYEQIRDAADPRSKVALHLRLNLEEFDRMQRL